MSPKRLIPFTGAALAASLGAFVLASPTLAAHSRTYVVKAQNIMFTPAHLVIHRGDRVTWKFLDLKLQAPHTVTSTGRQRFKGSPRARYTGSFTTTFAKRGTYTYQCTQHPLTMSNGVITVR